MSLVERLGYKSLDELYDHMDNNQIMEWAAYDKLSNEEWLKKVKMEKSLEMQKNQSLEKEAEMMRAMFMGLAK